MPVHTFATRRDCSQYEAVSTTCPHAHHPYLVALVSLLQCKNQLQRISSTSPSDIHIKPSSERLLCCSISPHALKYNDRKSLRPPSPQPSSSPQTCLDNLSHPIFAISPNPTCPSSLIPRPAAFCGGTIDVVDMPALFSFSSRRIRTPAAEMPIAMAKRGSRVLQCRRWLLVYGL